MKRSIESVSVQRARECAERLKKMGRGHLTERMVEALSDAQGPGLIRLRTGWHACTAGGGYIRAHSPHLHGTVKALAARRYLALAFDRARITEAGQRALIAARVAQFEEQAG